jgi:hypothetical protein
MIEYGEHAWPDALLDPVTVRAWIAAVLPETGNVNGPTSIHQAKEWGVTASFVVSGPFGEREVIFKAELLRLFAGAARTAELLSRVCRGAVPELLVWEPWGEGFWSLFAAFDGRPVEEVCSLEMLSAMARTLAQIQLAVATLPVEEHEKLPRLAAQLLPRLYQTVMRDVRERQLAYWAGDGRELAEQFAVPVDVLEQMEYLQPFITAWTEELLAGKWPDSIDHVDLHSGNAMVKGNGDILIYDWEEANLSCPFFSLDRLLDDARDLEDLDVLDMQVEPSTRLGGLLPYTPAEQVVRDVYLASLPWGNATERERGFDLAMCLAPIKTAYESIVFAEALGWEEGSPHIIAWALGRGLPRWRAMLPTSTG